MKIKRIVSRHRRDFYALFECEHCGYEEERSGYDDDYFHRHVIPQIPCHCCGKTSPDGYIAMTPKYPGGVVI